MGRIRNWMRPIAVHSELDNFLIIVVIWMAIQQWLRYCVSLTGGGTPCMVTRKPFTTGLRQKTSGMPVKSSHREKAANNIVKNCDGVNKEEFLQRRRFK